MHPLQPHTCAPPLCDPLTSETPGITAAEAPLQQTGSSTRDLEGFPVHTPCVQKPSGAEHPGIYLFIDMPRLLLLLWVQPFMWFNCLVHLYTWVWQTLFSSQPSTPCVFFLHKSHCASYYTKEQRQTILIDLFVHGTFYYILALIYVNILKIL